MSVMVTDFQ